MAEDKKSGFSNHSIVLDRRESAKITGVTDVVSFDEESVVACTDMGTIVLRGANLRVGKIDLDSGGGELSIDGDIDSLEYCDGGFSDKGKGSLWGKIFK